LGQEVNERRAGVRGATRIGSNGTKKRSHACIIARSCCIDLHSFMALHAAEKDIR